MNELIRKEDMDSKFNPPKNQAEFEERVKGLDLKSMMSVINALRSRRASMVRPLDVELEFLELGVSLKSGDKVDWDKKKVTKKAK